MIRRRRRNSIPNGLDWSKEAILKRLLSNSITENEHLLWQGSGVIGYGRLEIGRKKYLVHRLAAWIYFDLDLDNIKTKVLHKDSCRHRNCFSKNCIFIGTQSQNLIGAYRTGRIRTLLIDGKKNNHDTSV